MDKLNDLLEKSNLPNEAKTIIKMGSILNFDPIPFAINITNTDLTKKAKNTIMPIPERMDKTQIIIHKMLKESTGINCMDSGGDNGRSWQKNQKVFDFRRQDDINYNIENGYLYASNNIFHFLTNALEYEESMTDIFNDHKDDHDIEDITDILNDHYNDLDFEEFHEFKLKGKSFNSYNWESNLSQVIRGQIFTEYEDTQYEENYIILQIHNGADVRGGYTDPKIFKVDLNVWHSQDDYSLFCDCQDIYKEDSKPDQWKIIKKNRTKYADKIYYCRDCLKRVQIRTLY